MDAFRDIVGDGLVDELLASTQTDEAEIAAQRARVAELKKRVLAAKEERSQRCGATTTRCT